MYLVSNIKSSYHSTHKTYEAAKKWATYLLSQGNKQVSIAQVIEEYKPKPTEYIVTKKALCKPVEGK